MEQLDLNKDVGTLIDLGPTDAQTNGSNPLGLSFTNFKNTALTSVSASNIAGWWYFNNINGISGFDMAGGLTAAPGSTAMEPDRVGNISSNTGSVVGNATIKILDSKDLTLGTSGNSYNRFTSFWYTQRFSLPGSTSS